MKNERTQIFEMLKNRFYYLTKIGGQNKILVLAEFVYHKINDNQIKAIIGHENFVKQYKEYNDPISITGMYLHDIIGIMNNDKFFIPKFESYIKHY